MLALLIADLAAVPMQDFGIPLLTGIIPILTLLCLTMALSVLTMKSVRFRAVLCGRPSIIVENGKLHQREMQKNRFTVDELMEELRMKGITDLNSIKYAILETNGQISVLPYAAQQPVTAAQMELHPKEPGLPLVIINDGRVLEHNLRQRGLDDIWLDRQLKAHHAHPPAPFRHRSDLYRFSGGARVPHLPGGRGVLRRQRPAHDPDLPALRGRTVYPEERPLAPVDGPGKTRYNGG